MCHPCSPVILELQLQDYSNFAPFHICLFINLLSDFYSFSLCFSLDNSYIFQFINICFTVFILLLIFDFVLFWITYIYVCFYFLFYDCNHLVQCSGLSSNLLFIKCNILCMIKCICLGWSHFPSKKISSLWQVAEKERGDYLGAIKNVSFTYKASSFTSDSIESLKYLLVSLLFGRFEFKISSLYCMNTDSYIQCHIWLANIFCLLSQRVVHLRIAHYLSYFSKKNWLQNVGFTS